MKLTREALARPARDLAIRQNIPDFEFLTERDEIIYAYFDPVFRHNTRIVETVPARVAYEIAALNRAWFMPALNF